MAQTGYTPILIYSSSTAAQAPAVGNLTNSTLGSELAINISDGKLFYKDSGNAIQVIAWKVTPTTAGGTGLTSYTAGDLLYYASGTALSKLAIGATGRWLGSSGSAPQWNAPAALTKTDDTNVTLTLGGSASTALLNAASITVGWTGTLATTRGGTGLSSFTANGVLYASSTSTLATNSSFNYSGTQVSINTSTLSIGKLTIDTTAQTGIDIFRSDVSANYGAIRLRNQTNSADYGTVGFDSLGLRLDGDAGRIVLSSSGVERFHVDSSGNFVPQAAAKGINFTANTPAAGKTSQLLNWYEEGTWTPVDSSGAGLSFTNASGYYTRNGNIVTLFGRVTFPATASGAAVAIGGLPFTVANNNQPGGGCIRITNSGRNDTVVASAAATTITFYSTSLVNATNANYSGSRVDWVVTYMV